MNLNKKDRNFELIDLKLDLLLEGINVEDSALYGLGTLYREEIHWLFEWDSHNHEARLSPSEIIFEENDMITQVYENEKSSYKLIRDREKDKLILLKNNNPMDVPVKYPTRPKVLSECTSDGIPISKIVGFRGVDCMSVSFSLYCKFWDTMRQCKFCNIQNTKELSEQKAIKQAEWISEAISMAYKNKEINHFIITGGTFDKEVAWVERIFNQIKEKTGMDYFPGSNCTMTAPVTTENLKLMSNFGSDFLSMNLEIYSEEIFKQLCPGKDWQVGYRNWINRLIEAVDYKGWGHVRSNFVAGLEPMESLMEGAEFLASKGVLPAFIPFKKPFSPNVKDYSYTKEDYWKLTIFFNELYEKYNLQPSYCHKCYCNSTYIDYHTFFVKNNPEMVL